MVMLVTQMWELEWNSWPQEGLLAITEGAKKDAQKLWETVKSSWSKIGTKMGKK